MNAVEYLNRNGMEAGNGEALMAPQETPAGKKLFFTSFSQSAAKSACENLCDQGATCSEKVTPEEYFETAPKEKPWCVVAPPHDYSWFDHLGYLNKAEKHEKTIHVGAEALFWAVESCNRKMVETLIAAGADLHAKNSVGKTVLQIALEKRYLGIAEALIRAGASLPKSSKTSIASLRDSCETLSMVQIDN